MAKEHVINLTREEEVEYLKLALNAQDIHCNLKAANMILMTLDILKRKGGDFSIKDAAMIKHDMDLKYAKTEEDENKR